MQPKYKVVSERVYDIDTGVIWKVFSSPLEANPYAVCTRFFTLEEAEAWIRRQNFVTDTFYYDAQGNRMSYSEPVERLTSEGTE
jgi:hypothetical protein